MDRDFVVFAHPNTCVNWTEVTKSIITENEKNDFKSISLRIGDDNEFVRNTEFVFCCLHFFFCFLPIPDAVHSTDK